ncbi:DUF3102 domain-containing protein [Anaerotignum propionicum]|uniref:ParB-like nuclease domain protein n=1 Tax=Anaerotignum propionicum DSM 1682 TaxID=991789 RepID=A0A0X8VCC8_ANAPI|nr:DUF3102 domain-containing protein [Anaerotignum propionicum]AMJ42343.1 ParB-like nuclease domain protein [Anaerotignum propionicum DSM 1682]SHF00007.1 ParB-like nuclease domain-containing protein [[Clostridium] propionicum DSM 1682] [Anaerotignum propionicum DSM 1682]
MENLTVRNLEVIENEIIQLKEQTARNIILIGKALIEAKSQLNHGTWGIWLEEKFDFTQRTANKFMQLATTFNVSNSNSLSNLGQTKLFLLMDLPDEKRDAFIEENDIESITTRELKEKIKNVKNIINQDERDYNSYQVKVSELKEFPNHTKYFPNIVGEQYINFLRSIETSGVIESIIITQDKMIVSGHQRVRACKDLGIETIPARYFYYDKKGNDSYEKELFSWFCIGNCMCGQMDYYREAKKHLDEMK